MLYQLSYQSLLPVPDLTMRLTGANRSKIKQDRRAGQNGMLQEGLEPPTLGLLDPCSTN